MRRDARVSPTLANASPDEAAAGWTARLDKGPLSAGEQQALQHWLEQDVRHKGAFLRAKAIWHASGRLAALQGPTAPAVAHPATLPALPRRRFFAAAAATVHYWLCPSAKARPTVFIPRPMHCPPRSAPHLAPLRSIVTPSLKWGWRAAGWSAGAAALWAGPG